MSTPRNLSERYELGRTLGFGGMSEVHAGRDLRLDRDVAVKVLRADLARDPTFYLRFRREAQNAAALNHPAIVAVYDTGEAEADDGPLPYIVMEHVDGDTLRDLLIEHGRLSPRRSMEIMGDVCAALDFSHRHGIVHRDVKPANIMLNRAGAVKVMDFGIARAIADGTSAMTQTAAVIGTAQYLSPEQARGEAVDARSDVYAAGCVLFELLTGEPPFTGDSPVAVAYQHVREDPRTPSSVNPAVPPALDSVVLKAMSKNPANRYQSAGEMRSDIVRVLAGQRPSAPAVMTDDDRTEILGAVPPAPPGKHRNGGETPPPTYSGAVAPYAPAGGANRRTGLIAAGSVLGVALIGLIVYFLVVFTGGPNTVAMPALAGATSDVAQTQLANLDLKSRISRQSSTAVPEDTVISTDPDKGSVEVNSTVTLVVSSGPAQVQVPQLQNLTQEQATAALTDARLVPRPDPAPQPSDTVAAGSVISASPSSGAAVDEGTAVTLVISAGAAPVRVPSVVGQTEQDAMANLQQLEFIPVSSAVDSAEPKGTVIAQNPPGAQQAPKKSTVTLNVSSGNRILMPNLVGVRSGEVLGVLAGRGYTGGRDNVQRQDVTVPDPAQDGVVTEQSVAEGQEIEPNSPLIVRVGVLPEPTTTAAPPTTTKPAAPTTSPDPTPTTSNAPPP